MTNEERIAALEETVEALAIRVQELEGFRDTGARMRFCSYCQGLVAINATGAFSTHLYVREGMPSRRCVNSGCTPE